MIVSRFAPSPTGRLHLGHAFSAVVGRSHALSHGGRFLLRIEDLDATRSRPEHVEAIFEDLRWLGLDWGPPTLIQSERSHTYRQALERLQAEGLIYACFCTRADVAAAQAAPHGPAASVYPGTCRNLSDDPQRRALHPHCWRLDSAKAIGRTGLPAWREEGGRTFTSSREDIGDEVLARKDAPAAYHLACVIDDAASGVTLVTRGCDLRPSTPVQRLLQIILGLPEPIYLHHPLVVHADGQRLAKRDLAPTLAAMRARGADGHELANLLATGLVPSGFRLATS